MVPMKYLTLYDSLVLIQGQNIKEINIIKTKPFSSLVIHLKGFSPITTDDNIMACKVIQFVPLNLFTIANMFLTIFGIQLCLCFLWHMSTCNTTKTQNDLWKTCMHIKPLLVAFGNCLNRDSILYLCYNCLYFFPKCMI
jgi:hypothetical protein